MTAPQRLTASVRRHTGNTRHILHGAESRDLAAEIVAVQIEPTDEGVLLLYLDARGRCLTDTWHASIDDAKSQAHFEFDITEGDWALSAPDRGAGR